MSTLEIICIIYGIGFILNSLLAVQAVESLRRTDPDRFVSPILVMICVFLSFALWVYVALYLLVKGITKLFRKGGSNE